MRTDLSDANFYGLTLYSEKEKEADKILRAIVRASNTATIWNKEHPSVPLPVPGMEFSGMWVLRRNQI